MPSPIQRRLAETVTGQHHHAGLRQNLIVLQRLPLTIDTSRAMGLFPQNAGTSASAGNVIIFISGGLISGLVSQTGEQVMTVLPITFLLLSGIGMGLNALVQRPAHVS